MTWRSRRFRALAGAVGAAALSLFAAAPASASTVTLVPYLATGYQYLVVSHDALPGFSASTFDDSAFQTGDAAFGTGGFCPLDSTPKTYWPANSDLLTRRVVNVPAGVTAVNVGVAIDNNVQVYWNGTLIGANNHDGCAARDSYVYSVPSALLTAGANLLAVRAIDTGGEDYFDVTVTATGNPASISAAATSNGAPYTSGTWTNHDVAVTFTCTSVAAIASLTAPQLLSTEGANQSVAGSCTDALGNTATTSFGGIDIDKTPPVIAYSAHPAIYGVADSVSITCTASDALSGLASSTCQDIAGPASEFPGGLNTFSASATDRAGNSAQATTQFTVVVTGADLCALATSFNSDPRVREGLCNFLEAADLALAHGDSQAAELLTVFQKVVGEMTPRYFTAAQSALLQQLAAALVPAAND